MPIQNDGVKAHPEREAPHLERYDSTSDPNTDDYKFGILIPVA